MPSRSRALPLLRDELIQANLEKLRMLELLTYEDAGRLFERLLDEELAAVRASMPTLQQWEGLPRRSFRIYSRGANVVRLRRLLDWVMDGERILDIGTGLGYVTTMLLRHCTVEYYCGIDIHERYLAIVEEGLRVNGAAGVPHVLERLDLFKLTPEFVDHHRPTLVIVLEVLEHLRDPATALQTIAAAVPPSADVLFTVPMHGRLESVKGHLSVFDAAQDPGALRAGRPSHPASRAAA